MAEIIAYLAVFIIVVAIIMAVTGLGLGTTLVSMFFCFLFCAFRR